MILPTSLHINLLNNNKMRKFSILLTLLGIAINVFGQQEVKFQVEELSKPEELLHNRNYDDLYKKNHSSYADSDINHFNGIYIIGRAG